MENDSATILCPIDFSDLSAHALRYAAEIAGCRHSPVIALYAAWWDAPPYFTPARIARLEKEFQAAHRDAEHNLNAFVVSALGGMSGVTTCVVEALPADGILRTGQRNGASLIVMGTHGRSGWNRWTLGSVAERVLRESPVPVLTVRSPLRQPIRKILCPVSDTPESRRALEEASRYGACFGAMVTAFHVHEPEAAASIPNLCAWIPAEQRARCQLQELVRRGNAAEEIIRLAADEEFDLLVIGAARRRFFEGMVLGNTTLKAVRHAYCPVLTVSAGSPPDA
jgi:nucleotide-binding universal stress UspA family protein